MKTFLLYKQDILSMKLIKAVFCLAIFLSVFSTVLALPEIITDVNVVTDEISYNGIAEFELEITNNQDISERIYIPPPRSKWTISLDKYIIELEPHETKTITLYAMPDENVKKGKYSIYIQLKAMENKEASKYQYFHVKVTEEMPDYLKSVSVSREIKEEAVTKKSFLRETHEVNLTNVGKVPVEDFYYIEVSTLESFFIKAEPREYEEVASPEGKTFVWQYNLKPGESYIIHYSISYIPLIIAVVLIFAAAILLFSFYQSKFILEKEIILHKRNEERKKHTIKIKLCLKNKTAKKQTNVVIKDSVPNPLVLTGDFGTVEPTAIKRESNKTDLVWRFDVIEPYEERIVTYEMRSSLKLIGRILLPKAILEHKVPGRKTLKIYSKITKFEL